MPGNHTEFAFEEAIEDILLKCGWIKGSPADYDSAVAFDPIQLFRFITNTQSRDWEKLRERRGGDEAVTKAKFLIRLSDEINRRGTIDVLRRGITELGVHFSLAFFRPAHSLTPELIANYEANRCVVTRQLPYSPKNNNTLDLTLFVNGIPTATAEIKNALTGQTASDAKAQYRNDRDPRDQLLSKRTVVHFALDTDVVFLTTQLAGPQTEFLPFNQGTSGGGAGNPPPRDAAHYSTSYLFEEVWQRDSWLDILAKFVHVEKAEGTTKKRVIFPRYHQLDAVRKTLADVLVKGPGTSYLFEHSPGSGKTNTIAWLTYRLSSLHDAHNKKLFSKVIVITDRRALDKQLQDTIFQFDHTPGVVQKIDKNSTQLAGALQSLNAQVIITTLQKFPFVVKKMEALEKKSFAVVIDEAHSSQTGETQKTLKEVLGAGNETAAEIDVIEHEDGGEDAAYDEQDVLALAIEHSANARAKQSHLSYFGFTATPKPRTLELFGTRRDGGNYYPFHTYSMRQAIEEHFILDVLANYTTYKTYWNIAKSVVDDPDVPEREAALAIAKYVSLHPSNLAQKTEIIIEHFLRHTRGKIGGKAKAMVVTSSRLHAVRYKLAFDRYITKKGYTHLKTLVAFSGTVIDDENGGQYTEANFNRFSEAQLPEKFHGDEYQVLIVAEKYQTGYDEPLLHTMYVDKKLEGIKAVQTLCRLNRIADGKTDTFVLDFHNSAFDIQEAFKSFYDTSIAEPTDPNILYTAAARIEGSGVVDRGDIDNFVQLLLSDPCESVLDAKTHAGLYANLHPALERFRNLEIGGQEEFRQAILTYVRLYAFLSQILPWADAHLESLYLYCRALANRLPRIERGVVDLGDDVTLTYLRTQVIAERENISLQGSEPEEEPGTAFSGEGAGPQNDRKALQLSILIDQLNDRFGTEFTKADQLYFDQLEQAMIEDPDLRIQGEANTIENFKYGYDKSFEGQVINRRDANNVLFAKLMNDSDFKDAVKSDLMGRVYVAIHKNETAS